MYKLVRQEMRFINDEIELLGTADTIETSDNFEELKELAIILREIEMEYGTKTTADRFIAFFVNEINNEEKPIYIN